MRGRPRKIKSVKHFEELSEAYIERCKTNNEPVLLTGLILALGLSSRESLDEYGRREEFSDPVKKAKLRVQAEYEKQLYGRNPAGAIFALKNFGWSDRPDTEKLDAPVQLPNIVVNFVKPNGEIEQEKCLSN